MVDLADMVDSAAGMLDDQIDYGESMLDEHYRNDPSHHFATHRLAAPPKVIQVT